MGWDGDVRDGDGALLEAGDDGEVRYGGNCAMLGIPWDHAKPGGPG
jgi:hypothetical protein